MEEEYKSLKPQIHICPVCGKKSEWYAVHEINQDAPCSAKCQMDMRKKEKKG